MTGPREELLASGTLGPVGIALLYRTVRQVVRMRNLPPPTGYQQWDEDAFTEAGNEVFASRGGTARFVALAAGSFDEDSFRKSLWTTVARDLVSHGRRTERGALAERVADVLPHVPDVVELPSGRLGLTSSVKGRGQDAGAAAAPARYDELIAAAADVMVTVPAWDEASSRRAPLADRPSFVAMISAVLGRCPAGLPMAELVDVLAVRLGVHDAAVAHDHSMLEEYHRPARADTAATAMTNAAARELLSRLSITQRLVLPYLEDSATEIAARTGLGRTKAWKSQAELREVLQRMLADVPDAGSVLHAAVEGALADPTGGGS